MHAMLSPREEVLQLVFSRPAVPECSPRDGSSDPLMCAWMSSPMDLWKALHSSIAAESVFLDDS